MGLSLIFHFLLKFDVQLLHYGIVRVLVFGFALVLSLVELVHSLLELLQGLLIVFLALLLLLFKEFEFAFPECFLFFKLALKIGMCSLHLIVLAFPLLNLLSNSDLSLRKCLV